MVKKKTKKTTNEVTEKCKQMFDDMFKRQLEPKEKNTLNKYDMLVLNNLRAIRLESNHTNFMINLYERSKWTRFYLGTAIFFLGLFGLTGNWAFLINTLLWSMLAIIIGLGKQ